MEITPSLVASEYEWILDRAPVIVPLINDVRTRLGETFGTDVGTVSTAGYHDEVDAVFADGDQAVNIAGLTFILRELDVVDDYPGFIVDELLGRELAGSIAGQQPLRLLGEATFHFADTYTHDPDAPAGADDLDAALAAGFQTRLPGWSWRASTSPFAPEQ